MALDIPPDDVRVTVTFTRQFIVDGEPTNITSSLTYALDEYQKFAARDVEALKSEKVGRYATVMADEGRVIEAVAVAELAVK